MHYCSPTSKLQTLGIDQKHEAKAMTGSQLETVVFPFITTFIKGNPYYMAVCSSRQCSAMLTAANYATTAASVAVASSLDIAFYEAHLYPRIPALTLAVAPTHSDQSLSNTDILSCYSSYFELWHNTAVSFG